MVNRSFVEINENTDKIPEKMSQFLKISKCEVVQIDQLTPEWFALRIGFITMSALGSIFIFSRSEFDKRKRARILCGIEEETFTPEVLAIMKYGTEMENEIRQKYSERIGIPIHEVGLCISNEDPLFRGSPDGIIENGDLLEIKTTSKKSPTTYSENFSEIPPWHMWQMQGNMFITGAENCHYVCYSKTDNQKYYRIIPYKEEIWNPIMEKSIIYFNKYMKPLVERNLSTNGNISRSSDDKFTEKRRLNRSDPKWHEKNLNIKRTSDNSK